VRARLLSLLEHGDGDIPEALARAWVLLEQLPEPDSAREPRGPGADDQDADVDPLLGRVARLRDVLAVVERWRKISRSHAAARFRVATALIA
jgi:hypothetical protein